MVPSSVEKRNTPFPLVVPSLITNDEVVLKTMPDAAPGPVPPAGGGMVTNGILWFGLPVLLKTREVPDPLLLSQKSAGFGATSPHGFTRFGLIWSAATAPSEIRSDSV